MQAPMQPSLEHCIWFRDQAFAFIYLPKVACTSWKLFLWQASGHILPPGLQYRDVHDASRLSLPYVGQMPTSQQQDFLKELAAQRIKAAAVIREPRSRVLSAYLDKILLHSNPQSKFSRTVLPAIQRVYALKPGQRPSFEQFLRWNQSHVDRRQWNPHWRPMVDLLGTPQGLELWPMERIDAAAQSVNRHLGSQVAFPQRQALGPRLTHNSQTKLDQFYGPSELTLVEEMYRDDLKLHAELVA